MRSQIREKHEKCLKFGTISNKRTQVDLYVLYIFKKANCVYCVRQYSLKCHQNPATASKLGPLSRVLYLNIQETYRKKKNSFLFITVCHCNSEINVWHVNLNINRWFMDLFLCSFITEVCAEVGGRKLIPVLIPVCFAMTRS